MSEEELAKRMKLIREATGLSQNAAAAKIGMSQSHLSKWERGESAPLLLMVIAWARGLGVSLDDLASEDWQPPAPRTKGDAGGK